MSGRYARFGPSEPLTMSTRYVIAVDEGLVGVFEEAMGGPVEIAFQTGELPAYDVSGKWLWEVASPVSGTILMANLMSTGGKLTGVILDGGGLVDTDHVEGFVAGEQIFIDPFLVSSPFGQIQVDNVNGLLEDHDGDGVADFAAGSISVPLYGEIAVDMVRQDD